MQASRKAGTEALRMLILPIAIPKSMIRVDQAYPRLFLLWSGPNYEAGLIWPHAILARSTLKGFLQALTSVSHLEMVGFAFEPSSATRRGTRCPLYPNNFFHLLQSQRCRRIEGSIDSHLELVPGEDSRSSCMTSQRTIMREQINLPPLMPELQDPFMVASQHRVHRMPHPEELRHRLEL